MKCLNCSGRMKIAGIIETVKNGETQQKVAFEVWYCGMCGHKELGDVVNGM